MAGDRPARDMWGAWCRDARAGIASIVVCLLVAAHPGTAVAAGSGRHPTRATAVSADELSRQIIALLANEPAGRGFKGVPASHWNRLSATAMAPSPVRPGVIRSHARVAEGWGYWIESRPKPAGHHVVEFYIVGEPPGAAPAHCTFPFDTFAKRLVRRGFKYAGPQWPPLSPRVNFFSRPYLPVTVITYVPSAAPGNAACVQSVQVQTPEQGWTEPGG